mgnify:CR=1 FL=1
MLDTSSATSHSAELALTALSSILKERACQKLKRLFLYKCFENVKKNESVSQSINLAHYILNNAYHNIQLDHENSLTSILKELDEKFSIVESLITDMEVHQARVKKELAGHKDYSRSNNAIRDKLCVGKYSYIINFNNRLVFLEFMINYPYYEMSLTQKQIERIWNLYVIDALFEADQSFLYRWLARREVSRFSDPIFMINKNEIPFFFNEILGNQAKFDYKHITQDGFSCFDSYFRAINQLEEKFRVGKSGNFKIIDLDYVGKKQLWDMFLVCMNKETLDSIVNLIVECHQKVDDSLEEKKPLLWEKLVSDCLNLMKEGNTQKKNSLIDRGVLLLMRFFDKFEGKNETETHKSPEHYRYMHQINMVVVLKPNNVTKTVQVGYMQTLGTLRRKIGEAFGLNVNEFKLSARGSFIDRDEDEMQINEYGYAGPFVVQKIQPPTGNQGTPFHPRSIVASNPEYFDLLFSLLSSDDSGKFQRK